MREIQLHRVRVFFFFFYFLGERFDKLRIIEMFWESSLKLYFCRDTELLAKRKKVFPDFPDFFGHFLKKFLEWNQKEAFNKNKKNIKIFY